MKITNNRLLKLLQFIEEIEKLKNIYRINTLSDGSRQESDAEHSWHLAMIILIIKDELGIKFNADKAIKIALIHDLIEIYTGDTWPMNDKEKEDKKIAEKKSADKLFSQLPSDLKIEFETYWLEYENASSEEAKIVKGLDKIVYSMHYCMSGKIVWNKRESTKEERMLYGMPHVKHNKVLVDILEYYLDRLEKIKSNQKK